MSRDPKNPLFETGSVFWNVMFMIYSTGTLVHGIDYCVGVANLHEYDSSDVVIKIATSSVVEPKLIVSAPTFKKFPLRLRLDFCGHLFS
jgi:hypothetical protein